MLNPQRNANISKRKFETGVTTLTLFLCVIGLLGMSIMSFFQTQSAFLPLNDVTMVFQGIQFGSWIAFLSALIFQYGQNAALYVKNHYCSGKIVINLLGIWNIKDTTICWMVFWLCAGIDAGTNCLWLYNQPDIKKQHPIFQIVEYSAMIFIVFVEEVLGVVLQALAHSFTLWKQIVLSESKTVKSKSNDNEYQKNEHDRIPTIQKQTQDKPNKYKPQFADRPNKDTQKPKNNQGQQQSKKQHESSYNTQNNQQRPQNSSGSRMSAIQRSPEIQPDWMEDIKRKQQSLKGKELYDKMDGMEDMPDD